MQISGFGVSDFSNASITIKTTPTNSSSASGNAAGSSDIGAFIDPLDAIAIVDETRKSDEDSSVHHLLSRLSADIAQNGDLADVPDAIHAYLKAVTSRNAYATQYTAPSAKFVADLTALSNDAASNNLSAALIDLAKAQADAPLDLSGPVDANAVSDFVSLQGLSLQNPVNGTSASGDSSEAAAATLSSHA